MPLQTFSGSFAINTVTGNQAITGVGFAPKAVIFMPIRLTADGNTNTLAPRSGMGIGVSSTSRVTLASFSSTSLYSNQDNTKCLSLLGGTGTIDVNADLVSLDANGFTINVTNTTASAYIINFLAIGGADLTNVFLKQFTAPAVTGSQSTTGVGFKPDAAIFITANDATAPPDTVIGSSRFGVGMATNSTHRGYTCNRSEMMKEITTAAIGMINSTGSGMDFEADLTSFDSDGFTLNFGTTNSGVYIWALCLKGGQYFVSSDTQKTSTGTKATTGVGFIPTGVLFSSWNSPASTNIDSVKQLLTLSSMSSATQRGYIGGGANSTDNYEALSQTKALGFYSLPTPTLNAEADFSSFDVGGFTLNWTTADATAREFIYLAMGNNATSVSPSLLALLGVG